MESRSERKGSSQIPDLGSFQELGGDMRRKSHPLLLLQQSDGRSSFACFFNNVSLLGL